MCGLFGYNVPEYTDKIRELMTVLAVFNEDRGTDAFGWTNGQIIVKDGGPISQKFDEIPFYDELVGAFHTRAGTSGPKMEQQCAHPWKMVDKYAVIGMHNGYVSNHHELNRIYDRSFMVDSMHMVAHAASGLPYTNVQFNGVFLYFEDGAGPFVFRTAHRDLEVLQLKDGGVVWSSDWTHLRRSMSMLRIPYSTIYQPPLINQLYKLADNGMFKLNIEVPTMPEPPKQVMVFQSRQHYLDNVTGDIWDDQETRKIESYIARQQTPKAEKVKRKKNIGQWRTLAGDKTQTWIPCFHQKTIKIMTFPNTFTCGCFENNKFQESWPICWRPLGEWEKGRWIDCWHSENSKYCRCEPFSKKTKAFVVVKDDKNDASASTSSN
jgi:hypothetical protein